MALAVDADDKIRWQASRYIVLTVWYRGRREDPQLLIVLLFLSNSYISYAQQQRGCACFWWQPLAGRVAALRFLVDSSSQKRHRFLLLAPPLVSQHFSRNAVALYQLDSWAAEPEIQVRVQIIKPRWRVGTVVRFAGAASSRSHHHSCTAGASKLEHPACTTISLFANPIRKIPIFPFRKTRRAFQSQSRLASVFGGSTV